MNELLSKLSSYNLLNYLLPGVIFVVVAKNVTHYNFIQDDIILGLFIYYFIGLIISRIGSLVIKPFLDWRGFIQYAAYEDYIEAEKENPKLEILTEQNNTYRTICGLFASLLILLIYGLIEAKCSWLQNSRHIILSISMFILFLFAFRKQTQFIKKRVDKFMASK